jgi:hypothetical protein
MSGQPSSAAGAAAQLLIHECMEAMKTTKLLFYRLFS